MADEIELIEHTGLLVAGLGAQNTAQNGPKKALRSSAFSFWLWNCTWFVQSGWRMACCLCALLCHTRHKTEHSTQERDRQHLQHVV
jgi:hypothetical protein